MSPAGTAAIPFHVMAKPSGAICNLDCTYCFFLSKEMLYPGDRFRMADEVLAAYITQVIAAHPQPEVTISWQGGEPTLLGVPFFERAMAHVEANLRPGQRAAHTIQTNGTLLDDRWGEFLAANGFLVGLSIDGPQSMHDAYRVDKRGTGSFERVMRGHEVLNRHGVDVNILCTVHAANADHPLEVYRFFRDDLGATFLQFIPIVERTTEAFIEIANIGWGAANVDRPLYTNSGDRVTDRSVRPEQWGAFLCAIFDEWVHRDVGEVFIQHFDAALASWLGIEPALCIFRETCGTALALEHNGDLYSCDHFVEPDHLLGNILEHDMAELVASAKQTAFGNAKRDTLPSQCLRCEVRFACNGECPKNRFLTTADGESGLNYLCAGYLRFFTHIDRPMRLMAELLRAGRDAPEVMAMLADDGAAPSTVEGSRTA